MNRDPIVDGLVLFCRSEAHQHYSMEDLNHYLVIPNRHDKLRVYYEDDKPIGLVTWAWLTKDRADQFLLGLADLNDRDYKAEKQDNLQFWGIDFISPYGKARKIMAEIKKEHAQRYGKSTVRFRRFKDMSKVHRRNL